MSFARRHRRFTVWIATLAVLLAALAPAVSHALAAARSPTALALCSTSTASGPLRSTAAEGGQGDTLHGLAHCPYCLFQVPVSGLPPATPAVAAPALPPHGLPAAFDAAPRRLHAWVSALPRAPPARC